MATIGEESDLRVLEVAASTTTGTIENGTVEARPRRGLRDLDRTCAARVQHTWRPSERDGCIQIHTELSGTSLAFKPIAMGGTHSSVVLASLQPSKENLVKITSKWNGGPVFVRVFGSQDTVYIFGRWETTLKFGESVEFNLPEGWLQLEIKKDGLFGPFIVRPGHKWSNDDVRLLNDEGELVQPDANDVNTDVATDLDVTIKYFLGAEKTEHEHLQRMLHVSGPAEQRRVNMDEFSIVRDATIKVEALHGAFAPATGEMSLSAKVSVSFIGIVINSAFVGLTTNAASSGQRFSDTGSVYDATTQKFKLVGGGVVAGAEFLVVVEGVCSSPLG